jgi:DNA polymerase-1
LILLCFNINPIHLFRNNAPPPAHHADAEPLKGWPVTVKSMNEQVMADSVLHLIDGHSLTFRAYYAIRNLTAPDGKPTGAVYGFLRMLLGFIRDLQPSHLAIVFDTGKPTFRNEIYGKYKANRDAPPPDFSDQMTMIFRLLEDMKITTYQLDGYEADDLIGTMASSMSENGDKAIIISSDKDLLQLVNDNVCMLRPGSRETRLYDPKVVEDELGIRPDQVIDWLALVGDSSDNIPGVPGIGAKTATSLLQQFNSLDAMLADIGSLPRPRQREALSESRETVLMAQQLAMIRRDVTIDWSFSDCRLADDIFTEAACRCMMEYGFDSILREYEKAIPGTSTPGDAGLVETMELDYRVIYHIEELHRWCRQALSPGWVALDTETTSTDAMRAVLVGISMSYSAGSAVYVPVGHQTQMSGEKQPALDQVIEILNSFFREVRISAHHAKYDWKIMKRAGFDMPEPAFDSMIASYLLDSDRPGGHGLKNLGRVQFDYEMQPISDLIGSGRNAITMDEVDVESAGQYACADADITLRLTEYFRGQLSQVPELERLMYDLELPLVSILLDMELGGIRLDPSVLEKLGSEVSALKLGVMRQIWEAVGHEFNIGSPRQVAGVLYDELGLKPGKKGKTGYSTNEVELERLAPVHPVPRLILEYRGYEKLQSTYIETLPRLVHPETGRIHTSFNQTAATTGRLSSTEPNLQNIPVRAEPSRAIRRGFIADTAQHELLKADYSQIELRILAHFSGDETLCKAYSEGRDIHLQTSLQVFGVEPSKVTDQMRAEAKIINFGIVYGMSPFGLSRQLGVSRSQAAEFIDRYFNTYPGVREWIDRMLAEARKTGMVKTLLGRRRWVPNLDASNRTIRSNTERIAVNAPIQGTSADMIKRAMIQIHRGLREQDPEAKMVCQVHDELVFSVNRSRLGNVSKFVVQCMTQALPLKVPVVVDLSRGPNWADCRPFEMS